METALWLLLPSADPNSVYVVLASSSSSMVRALVWDGAEMRLGDPGPEDALLFRLDAPTLAVSLLQCGDILQVRTCAHVLVPALLWGVCVHVCTNRARRNTVCIFFCNCESQVHTAGVSRIRRSSRGVDTWASASARSVVHGTCNSVQCIVALSDKELVYLECTDGVRRHMKRILFQPPPLVTLG